MRFMLALLAVLFFAVQTASAAHVAEYGDHDSHDGVPCALAVAHDRVSHDAGTPPVADVLILPVFEAQVFGFIAETLIIPPITESPPGRAPPTL